MQKAKRLGSINKAICRLFYVSEFIFVSLLKDPRVFLLKGYKKRLNLPCQWNTKRCVKTSTHRVQNNGTHDH